MQKPLFDGDLNAYIAALCEWADSERGNKRDITTITVDLDLVIFGVAGKKPHLASVSQRPISQDPLVNMGVYRKVLERQLEVAKNDALLKQQRIDELEGMFAEELRALEEKRWEEYGESL